MVDYRIILEALRDKIDGLDTSDAPERKFISIFSMLKERYPQSNMLTEADLLRAKQKQQRGQAQAQSIKQNPNPNPNPNVEREKDSDAAIRHLEEMEEGEVVPGSPPQGELLLVLEGKAEADQGEIEEGELCQVDMELTSSIPSNTISIPLSPTYSLPSPSSFMTWMPKEPSSVLPQ